MQGKRTGTLVISFDCEMLWGMRDHETKETYGTDVVNGHAAMFKILDLFKESGIHATWAYVGMCILENANDIRNWSPEILPAYKNAKVSNYNYLDDYDGIKDQCYYSGDVIDKIKTIDGQELASHTYSHYYCDEPGQTVEQFIADIEQSIKVNSEICGVTPLSLVFPRNQVDKSYVDALNKTTIRVYRGERKFYPKAKNLKSKLLRACVRLVPLIAYHNCYDRPVKEPNNVVNVPMSMAFSEYKGENRLLFSWHIKTIKRVMTKAAKNGKIIHIAFHPHNFGHYTEKNIDALEDLVKHYKQLNKDYGFKTMNMYEISQGV